MNFREITTLGAIIVSALTLGAFTTIIVLAYMHNDNTSQALLVGAIITMAQTAVGFWLGSSAGSQRKDQVIAASVATPPVSAPPTTPAP